MTDQMKNVLIGLFVTAAITIMIAMILFLEPTVGDGKKTLHVRFANIAGITVGTRVTFAGKPVGEVVHIQEVPNARTEFPDNTGRIYIYELTLKVDSSVDVYKNDEISLKTTGLMGEKSIAITPKLSSKNTPDSLITNQIIYANSVDPLENTFNQVTKVANRLEGTLDHVDLWFQENQKLLTQTLASFDGAMAQVESLLATVKEEDLVPAIRVSVDLINDNMRLIRSSLDDDQLLHKIANAAENFDRFTDTLNSDGVQTLRHLNQITGDIASGSGTLGRFIVGDDFYLRVSSLMSKGETLMNDINHYGLLFQYNKQWQRNRTKRANLLNALDSPREFRNYFEGEIDSMTTSLGRLTELVDRADYAERTEIVQSDAFKTNLAALLRQVQSFNDSLKLYTQDLMAPETPPQPHCN